MTKNIIKPAQRHYIDQNGEKVQLEVNIISGRLYRVDNKEEISLNKTTSNHKNKRINVFR